MKHALTVGCGGGTGSTITDTLIHNGYQVTNIGATTNAQCKNIIIQWNDLNVSNLHKITRFQQQFDFVFFNQNGSSLDQNAFDPTNNDTLTTWKLIKDWQQTHWISCQMPFLLLSNIKKNLTSNSKIGWMLSSTMFWDQDHSEQFPDYSSQKYFNYLSMKCFGKHYQTFGIMPNFSVPGAVEKLKDIIHQVCTESINCKVFDC